MKLVIKLMWLCLLCSMLIKPGHTQLNDETWEDFLRQLMYDEDDYDYEQIPQSSTTKNPASASVTNSPSTTTTALAPSTQQSVQSLHNFTFDIFNAANNEAPSGNMVLSPISIYAAMTMLRTTLGGQSLDEVNQVLGTTSISNRALGKMFDEIYKKNRSYDLTFVNRFFVDKSVQLLESFQTEINKLRVTQVRRRDFKHNSERIWMLINRFVKRNTNNMIENMLPQDAVTSLTRILLVNAMYLKANWTVRFAERHTQMRPFYSSSNAATMVETMNAKSIDCTFRTDEQLQTDIVVLGLDEQLSMIIFMPVDAGNFSSLLGDEREPMKVKFERLINDIWPAKDNYYRKDMNCNIYLPKFSIDHNLDMKSSLRRLGLSDIFDSNRADFSGLTESNLSEGSMSVTEVRHKVVFGTNEEGIEAAAATTLRVDLRNTQGQPVNVNRPFLFAVRQDATRAILFLGKVTQPSAS